VKDSLVTPGISGSLGKDLVSKLINGKHFHTKDPDGCQLKYTKEQAKIKVIYKGAAKLVGAIVNDAVKKASGKKKTDLA